MQFVYSLFDYSGNAVRDFARSGYGCYCLDIQHDGSKPNESFPSGGFITYLYADLDHNGIGWDMLRQRLAAHMAWGQKVAAILSFPPCDDMTSSGAKHFAAKREADPLFQYKAAMRARLTEQVASFYRIPWMVENPVGMLSTLWRKPDAYWDPYQFGGYLPEDDVHPTWPKYIAPRDAYTKRSGLWFGQGFIFPELKPVEPEILERVTKSGRTLRGSRQFMMLGGKSHKTKTIRNETPRGFAKAIYLANVPAALHVAA